MTNPTTNSTIARLAPGLIAVCFDRALGILVPVRQGLATNARISDLHVIALSDCVDYLERVSAAWSDEARDAAPDEYDVLQDAIARASALMRECSKATNSRFEEHSSAVADFADFLVESAYRRSDAAEALQQAEAAADGGDASAFEAFKLIIPTARVIMNPLAGRSDDKDQDVRQGDGDISSVESTDEVLRDLDSLIGLAEVKTDVKRLIAFISLQEKRKSAGLAPLDVAHHLVFVGPPGTGKTTVARIYGRLLRSLGVLETGGVVEAARGDLVAEYVGQTAVKTGVLIDKALGGVLFIDEAYSLAPKDAGADFGHEAIEVLLKRMEDQREQLAVIVAGYPVEMDRFISSNPGLESRFTNRISFPSYSEDDLVTVFASKLKEDGMQAGPESMSSARAIIKVALSDNSPSFGNARFVRKLCETAYRNQAARLMPVAEPTITDLTTLKPEDIVYDD